MWLETGKVPERSPLEGECLAKGVHGMDNLIRTALNIVFNLYQVSSLVTINLMFPGVCLLVLKPEELKRPSKTKYGDDME